MPRNNFIPARDYRQARSPCVLSLSLSRSTLTLAPIRFYTERTQSDANAYKYKTRRSRESSYRELSTLTYGM